MTGPRDRSAKLRSERSARYPTTAENENQISWDSRAIPRFKCSLHECHRYNGVPTGYSRGRPPSTARQKLNPETELFERSGLTQKNAEDCKFELPHHNSVHHDRWRSRAGDGSDECNSALVRIFSDNICPGPAPSTILDLLVFR
jgi:hypothetical protein